MKFQYITDKMNILKAPREKRQDTYKGLEMEYCVSQCNSGFQKKMKHCPQNSERKSCLLWNLPADKQKARSYHICKDPKFLFLILFLWKLIEDKVQEMRSYRREEKRREGQGLQICRELMQQPVQILAKVQRIQGENGVNEFVY